MSQNINPIQNGETGLSVRGKLNNLITKAQATSGSLNILSSSYENFVDVYNSGSFSGSFQGNGSRLRGIVSSSFANNALTAVSSSHALRANTAASATTAVSASHALRSVSGSHALRANTAASATTAVSASHALRAVSGSHALRANTAGSATTSVSASFATTASFATQVRTTSGTTDTTTWIPLVNNNITGGQPLVIDTELSYNAVTHVLNANAATAVSASHALRSVSGSHAIRANSAGTATTAATASLLSYAGNTNEVHVSAVEGVDAVGRGSLLYPYRTIGYALTRIGSTSGIRLIIHRGQYNESITITQTNMSIVGYVAGNGALVEILGTVTVNVPSPASTRISNIRINTLVHQNTGGLFINNTSVLTQATFGGTYAEVVDSRFECPSGILHNASGRLIVFGSTFSPLTTNHASAISFLKDNIAIVQPTLTAGTLAIVNSNVTGAVDGQPAINTSAGTLLSMVNSQVSTIAGAPSRINVLGNLSYEDCVFDKRNSVLGTQVPMTARFQSIDANLLQVTGSVSVRGNIQATTGLTGSFLGNVNGQATTSVSASHALRAVSSSHAVRANSAGTATSASYVLWNNVGSKPAGIISGSAQLANRFIPGGLTLTGSLLATNEVTANSRLISANSSGDEGGEILLAKPQTNTTLAGNGVTIDVYQNRLRFFENGGSARGAYINLTEGGAAASTNLLSGGGGGASVIISASAPVSESIGTLWYNSSNTLGGGELYILVDETSSNWVPVNDSANGGTSGNTVTFNQPSTALTWSVNHNLNTTTPLVTVWSNDRVIIPNDIVAIDANNSRVLFTTASAGKAVFSTGVGGDTIPLATTASFATTASYALNTPAVYGRTVMTSGTTVSVLNGATQTVLEFTIPSAGIWEVNYNVRTRTTAVNTYASIFLTNTSNTQIANTSTLLTSYIQGASGQRQATNGAGTSLDVFVNNVPLGVSDLQANTRGMDFLTTTGATTYRIRMTSVGGTTQALSDNNGQVVVWYRKIG